MLQCLKVLNDSLVAFSWCNILVIIYLIPFLNLVLIPALCSSCISLLAIVVNFQSIFIYVMSRSCAEGQLISLVDDHNHSSTSRLQIDVIELQTGISTPTEHIKLDNHAVPDVPARRIIPPPVVTQVRVKIKEQTPLLGWNSDHDGNSDYNNFPDDPKYTVIISQVELAIDHGIYPERISQGSSGSYFVKNLEGVRIMCVTCVLLVLIHE